MPLREPAEDAQRADAHAEDEVADRHQEEARRPGEREPRLVAAVAVAVVAMVPLLLLPTSRTCSGALRAASSVSSTTTRATGSGSATATASTCSGTHG